MDPEELERKDAEATHELIDGEVNKVDLVDRPATGDLWLAVRSADEAQTIVKQGDWNMPGTSAPKRSERSVMTRDEIDRQSDRLPVEVSSETDPASSGDQPATETVSRIGAAATLKPAPAPLTREAVAEVIGEVVPGVVAEALRALGLLGDSKADGETPTGTLDRAGAKMSSGRLKRFNGAISKMQEGLSDLDALNRELSGDEVERESDPVVMPPVPTTPAPPAVDVSGNLIERMTELLKGHRDEINEKLSTVSEDVKRVNDRVDKVKSALGQPSTIPNDDTEDVKREKTSVWGPVVRGTQ